MVNQGRLCFDGLSSVCRHKETSCHKTDVICIVVKGFSLN